MILVDSSEPYDIPAELGIAGVPTDITKLDVGDYVIGRFIIERKSSNDFYQSIYNRRIFDQLKRLNDLEDYKPILCVHGPFPPGHKWMRIKGRPIKLSLTKDEKGQKERTGISVLSTAVNSYHRVSILLLKSEEQFIKFIVDLYYRQTQKAKKPSAKKKADSLEQIKFNIFCQIPLVGSKGAQTLAKSDKSIIELSQMSVEDLCKNFNGIGKKRAEMLLYVLNT